jgi:hypothetical protein
MDTYLITRGENKMKDLEMMDKEQKISYLENLINNCKGVQVQLLYSKLADIKYNK